MQFIISDPDKKRNLVNLLRGVGYHFDGSKGSELAFYHSVSSGFFPRFHIYIQWVDGGWAANIHLDQKKPSYEGSHAHSGEYEGEIIEKEIARLKKALLPDLLANLEDRC